MIKKCVNCGKIYKTDLDRDKNGDLPEGTLIQKEQLISGICSNKCWKQFCGEE